jgi:hypothetical protein
MASSSSGTSPTRPVTPNLSSNYQGTSPLSDQPQSGNAITAKNSSRPNLPHSTLSRSQMSLHRAATKLREHIPRSQNGAMPIRQDKHAPNLPFSTTSPQSQKTNPNKKGLNRSANFNLLIACFENNFKRSVTNSQHVEKELIQELQNNTITANNTIAANDTHNE